MDPNNNTSNDRHSWYKDWAFLPIGLAVFGFDQLTKYLITSNMVIGQSIPAHGFLRITYTYNTGALFGLFPNQTFILVIASFLGIGFLLFYYHIHPFPGIFLRLSLGLQLGGAFGNLIDRVLLGHVTDFIDVGPWPVFNIADSSIVVGLAIIGYIVLVTKEEQGNSESAEEESASIDTKRSK